jgi:hypothetical protein
MLFLSAAAARLSYSLYRHVYQRLQVYLKLTFTTVQFLLSLSCLYCVRFYSNSSNFRKLSACKRCTQPRAIVQHLKVRCLPPELLESKCHQQRLCLDSLFRHKASVRFIIHNSSFNASKLIDVFRLKTSIASLKSEYVG